MSEQNRPERIADRKATGRHKRLILGGQRFKLAIPRGVKRAGKVFRWFRNSPGRLDDAPEAGWRFSQNPTAHVGEEADNQRDSMTTRIVRTDRAANDDGSPIKLYLMEKDQEEYEEDQEIKQAEINKIEESLHETRLPDGSKPVKGEIEEGLKMNSALIKPKKRSK